MRKYECKKTLDLEKFDEDGSLIGDLMTIEIGTEWAEDTESYKMLVKNDEVRLTRETDKNSQQWIEIDKVTLEKHFALKE